MNSDEVIKTQLVQGERCKEVFGLSKPAVDILVMKSIVKLHYLGDVPVYEGRVQYDSSKGVALLKESPNDRSVYIGISEAYGMAMNELQKKINVNSYEEFECFVVDKFRIYRFENSTWYIKTIEFYKYLYITQKTAMQMLGISDNVLLNQMASDGYIEKIALNRNVYYSNVEGKSYKGYQLFRTEKFDTEPVLQLNDFEDAYEIIDYMLELMDNAKFIETFMYVKEYLYYLAGNLHRIRIKNTISQYARTYVKVLNKIGKEISKFSDSEVEWFFESTGVVTSGNIYYVTALFEYIRTHSKKCCYSIIPRKCIINKAKTADDIYPVEIVEKYFYYLSDIEKHFNKAYYDQRYANLWLIALSHFCVAWRISSITLLPNVDIEIIDILSFEDLLHKGMDLSSAQTIINNVSEKTYGTVASKNGWNIPYLRDLDLLVQTATAFVLCELHRREKGHEILFEVFKNYSPSVNDWRKFFEDNDLKEFYNRKANRSFLVGIYEYANNKEGMKTLAYKLIRRLRGHIQRDGDSETPKIYVEFIKMDGHFASVAMQVQRRGPFGFLYNAMLEKVYEIDSKSTEDVTSNIETLQKGITHDKVEGLSSFLISDKLQNEILKEFSSISKNITDRIDEIRENHNIELNSADGFSEFTKREQEEITAMIKAETKENIRDKLAKIARGQLPSKTLHCQCIKGIKECPYKLREKEACIICKYSIPFVFCLVTVKYKIYELIDVVNDTAISDEFLLMKSRILLIKYMSVLSEAYTEFAKFDRNFIDSIINMKELKEKLLRMEEKFVELKGE